MPQQPDIITQIRELLLSHFGVPADLLTPEHAPHDMGLDSIDMLDLIFRVEELFGITLDGVKVTEPLARLVNRVYEARRAQCNLTLEIPEHAWGPPDEESGRLLAAVTVNGILFHVEALPVVVKEGAVEGATEIAEEMYGSLNQAFGGDSPWQNMEIRGGLYAVFFSPCRQ